MALTVKQLIGFTYLRVSVDTILSLSIPDRKKVIFCITDESSMLPGTRMVP